MFEITIPSTTDDVLIQNAVTNREVLTQQEQTKISALEGSMTNLETESASVVSQINSSSNLESTTIISALSSEGQQTLRQAEQQQYTKFISELGFT